jgi:hypothetical protein
MSMSSPISPFAIVPSPFRELMESIDPRAIYIFCDGVTGSSTSCMMLPPDASANDLYRIQKAKDEVGVSRTLRGDDVRAFILTLAQAHGLGRGVWVDLKAPVFTSEESAETVDSSH